MKKSNKITIGIVVVLIAIGIYVTTSGDNGDDIVTDAFGLCMAESGAKFYGAS
jgi:hypothetical protein